jgi:hypothetical protein
MDATGLFYSLLLFFGCCDNCGEDSFEILTLLEILPASYSIGEWIVVNVA